MSKPDRPRGRTHWLRGSGRLMTAEWRVIRGKDPDLDALDLTEFSGPLLASGLVVAVVGVLPLIGTRLISDAAFGPLVGSFALAGVATSAVAWMLSIVIAGLVVLIVYHVSPKAASATTEQAARASFQRINDATSSVTLVALISGLVSLALALPAMQSSDDESSVLEELLSAQIACLLLALVLGFSVEAIRSVSAILGSQVQVIASIGAFVITLISFYLASSVGPFEPVSLTRTLLDSWLPADVDGVPRDQVIDDLLPAHARAYIAAAITPYLAILWLVLGRRSGDLARLRTAIRRAGQ
ncbi:hypothetical protein ABLE94_19745 [Gordonia sp. VNK1]|uniref:hypothetical protein n=1 Tax=Gordonia oleivorans TaxID=3156618 RepID=UPI0032B4614D